MIGFRLFKLFVFLTILTILINVFIQAFLSFPLSPNTSGLPKELPVLFWWTPFISYNEIIQCGHTKVECLVTSNRTIIRKPNVYLFYGSRITNHDFPLPRNVNIPWALFHEESPRNYAPILFEDFQSLFNITSTFSPNSDFPITTQYLSKDEFKLLTDKKYYLPVKIKNTYLNSIAPVLYIQSDCDNPLGRDYLVEELSNYIQIDSYGKCLNNMDFPMKLRNLNPLDLYNEEYLNFISRYKFIIAFENAVCDDYITEKFWRPLIIGAIPIYFGSPTVEKWLPNRESAILTKNFRSMKAVANFIKKINTNDTLYESFMEHKIFSRVSNRLIETDILTENPVSAFQCFICKKVNEGTIWKITGSRNIGSIYNCPKSAVNNKTTWLQHWEIGKCQSKVLKTLIEKRVKYENDYFDDQWLQLLYEGLC